MQMCLRSEFSLIPFSDRAKQHNTKADFFIQHLCTVRLNPAGQNEPLSSFSKRSSTRKASAPTHQHKDLLCQTSTKLSQLTSRTWTGDSSSSNRLGAEEIP